MSRASGVGGEGGRIRSRSLVCWPGPTSSGALVNDDDRARGACVCEVYRRVVCAGWAGDSYYYYSALVLCWVPWRLPDCLSVSLVVHCLSRCFILPPDTVHHRSTICCCTVVPPAVSFCSCFCVCLSKGSQQPKPFRTLHARWILPRPTGAQGLSSFSLQHWKRGRRDDPTLLALHHHRPQDSAPLDIANLTRTLYYHLLTIATLSRDHPITTTCSSLAINKPAHIDVRPGLATPPSHACILKQSR